MEYQGKIITYCTGKGECKGTRKTIWKNRKKTFIKVKQHYYHFALQNQTDELCWPIVFPAGNLQKVFTKVLNNWLTAELNFISSVEHTSFQ